MTPRKAEPREWSRWVLGRQVSGPVLEIALVCSVGSAAKCIAATETWLGTRRDGASGAGRGGHNGHVC